MKEFSQFTAAPTATRGLLRHFSDTRTEEGRVRFLLEDQATGAVHLHAEGPGWRIEQRYQTLEEAALLLAYLPQLPQALYLQALSDLEKQQRFFALGGIDSAA